ALGEHSIIAVANLKQSLGIDYLSKATGAFSRAAEVDPSFVEAVLQLAAAASEQGVRASMTAVLDVVRRAAATGAAPHRELQLVLGRLSRELAQLDSALSAFHRYLNVGGDSALGVLELARTEYLLGRPREAGDHYYRAAAMADSGQAVAEFRSDVRWIATPQELEQFDSLRAGEREVWLRDFWGRRDVADVRRPGERLAEHFRRYFYAREKFRRVSRHRTFDIEERYQSDQDELDDRGVIYIRHGDPDRVVDLLTNASWQYLDPERPLIFHFMVRRGAGDYRLVESLFGFQAAVGNTLINPGLAASRSHMHSVYRRLTNAGSASIANYLATERALGREAIEVGTTTDGYRVRFEEMIHPLVRPFVFARERQNFADIIVLFAVPGSELVPMIRDDSAAIYPLEIRVAASLADQRLVGFVDTSRTFIAPRVLGDGEYLTGLVRVPVESGTYELRGVFRDLNGGGGATFRQDSVRVPTFELGRLGASDLIIGLEDAGLSWESVGDTIWLNPTDRYPRHSELKLYYEVYGLPRGETYTATLEVKKEGGGGIFGFFGRLFGGGGDRISLEFEGVADGPVTRVHNSVDLGDVGRGSYKVTLKLEFADGSTETRTSRLQVVDERA
ncbi:MAG: GWxTD domain-containing protein, partial [Gemmatimonadales bacterium]